ncbi:hypothetical protein CLU79DRAFT_756057 [Phycomyces nitens]|nr:hypothetical protein CLU79DRAFT_756057 [Phycomyces nitens]
MVTISREQAICMFYSEPYNESNVVKLSKLIENLDDIEICYSVDPTEPMLLCQTRINQNPLKYQQYPAFVKVIERNKNIDSQANR